MITGIGDLQNPQILASGLTEAATVGAGFPFSALPNVCKEIKQLNSLFPRAVTFLLDSEESSRCALDSDSFTRKNFQNELGKRRYSIVHIATHGNFGSVPEDTFLVTGDKQKFTITELASDLQRYGGDIGAIELLVLSACETARDNDRATLGFAGAALQTGVKSIVASLWSVEDESTTQLISAFYENLIPTGKTRAEALQEAQLKILEDGQHRHPGYWAPFILIGSWL